MRTFVCALIAALALPVAAVAATSSGSVRLVPDRAGRGSTLRVDVSPGSSATSPPQTVALLIARGLKFDPRARSARCTPSQASGSSCPKASQIGTGQLTAHASGALVGPGGEAFDAALQLFLAPPPNRGDEAGIVVQYSEGSSGLHGSVTGRVVRIKTGAYGSELLLRSPLAQGIPGVTVTVDRLQLTATASRSVTLGHAGSSRRVTRHLITNPPSCAGSWPYEIVLHYAGGDTTMAGAISCRSG